MIVFLNYRARVEYTSRVRQSLDSTDVYEVDRLGISAAINEGMRYWFEERGTEFVFLCSNDIVLPKGWKERMILAARRIDNTGMIAIHCVEALPPKQWVNGEAIHPAWGVFGDCLITRQAWQAVGYWNTDQDPYGMNDSDYCYRLNKAGFLNYYIADMRAEHVGHDVGNKTDYRKMKDDGLNLALGKFNHWKAIYDTGKVYLPYDQQNTDNHGI